MKTEQSCMERAALGGFLHGFLLFTGSLENELMGLAGLSCRFENRLLSFFRTLSHEAI